MGDPEGAIAQAQACVKLAPARSNVTTEPQPMSAAMATVTSSTASTMPLILPNWFVTPERVNAPTIDTNTSGMMSIWSSDT